MFWIQIIESVDLTYNETCYCGFINNQGYQFSWISENNSFKDM